MVIYLSNEPCTWIVYNSKTKNKRHEESFGVAI
jgi:hypothetical protein